MKIIYLLLLFFSCIYAASFRDFMCNTFNICGRDPNIQEFCDILDICFNGIQKTPTTTTPIPTTTTTPDFRTRNLIDLNKSLFGNKNCSISYNDIDIIKNFDLPILNNNSLKTKTNIALLIGILFINKFFFNL